MRLLLCLLLLSIFGVWASQNPKHAANKANEKVVEIDVKKEKSEEKTTKKHKHMEVVNDPDAAAVRDDESDLEQDVHGQMTEDIFKADDQEEDEEEIELDDDQEAESWDDEKEEERRDDDGLDGLGPDGMEMDSDEEDDQIQDLEEEEVAVAVAAAEDPTEPPFGQRSVAGNGEPGMTKTVVDVVEEGHERRHETRKNHTGKQVAIDAQKEGADDCHPPCRPGVTCAHGRCQTPCRTDTDCDETELCLKGRCNFPDKCFSRDDCISGYSCIEGVCSEDGDAGERSGVFSNFDDRRGVEELLNEVDESEYVGAEDQSTKCRDGLCMDTMTGTCSNDDECPEGYECKTATSRKSCFLIPSSSPPFPGDKLSQPSRLRPRPPGKRPAGISDEPLPLNHSEDPHWLNRHAKPRQPRFPRRPIMDKFPEHNPQNGGKRKNSCRHLVNRLQKLLASAQTKVSRVFQAANMMLSGNRGDDGMREGFIHNKVRGRGQRRAGNFRRRLRNYIPR